MAACRRRVVYRFAQGAGRKVLKMDRPAAGGFLSLTAFQAEGCGGGFAAKFKESTFLSSLVHPAPDPNPDPDPNPNPDPDQGAPPIYISLSL